MVGDFNKNTNVGKALGPSAPHFKVCQGPNYNTVLFCTIDRMLTVSSSVLQNRTQVVIESLDNCNITDSCGGCNCSAVGPYFPVPLPLASVHFHFHMLIYPLYQMKIYLIKKDSLKFTPVNGKNLFKNIVQEDYLCV